MGLRANGQREDDMEEYNTVRLFETGGASCQLVARSLRYLIYIAHRAVQSL